MAKRSSMRARLTNSALGLLAAGTVAVGVLALDLGAVEAGEIQLAGTLSQHPDGYLAFETDSTTYAVVAGMYTAPYLGRAVTVGGAIEAGTLYVSELTVGAIHLQDQAGSDVLQTTGTVEKSTDGYQVTVEGVVFTLIGSDQFDQVVG